MQSFAPPSGINHGIPPHHLRPKSDDQITHIEEILDNNPGPRYVINYELYHVQLSWTDLLVVEGCPSMGLHMSF